MLTQTQAVYAHVTHKAHCMGRLDWAFCSPGPGWRGKDPVPLVLARAQLHAADAPRTAACPAAGLVSDWTFAPLHGSFHSQTPLWYSTWRKHNHEYAVALHFIHWKTHNVIYKHIFLWNRGKIPWETHAETQVTKTNNLFLILRILSPQFFLLFTCVSTHARVWATDPGSVEG